MLHKIYKHMSKDTIIIITEKEIIENQTDAKKYLINNISIHVTTIN